MASVIVTLKIMPESPKVNLDFLYGKAEKEISEFGGKIGKKEIEEIAFGLKALNLIFIMDEAKGSTEKLEEKISKINGVNSVQVTDVRRTIG